MKQKQNKATSTVVANLRYDAKLTNAHTYKVFFKNHIERIVCSNFNRVITELLKGKEQPLHIAFSNGIHMAWNKDIVEYYQIKIISKKQLLQYLLIQKGGLQ